jgi:hypothetical protein
MSDEPDQSGMNDLISVPMNLLWEGDDEDFAHYVQSEFAVPPSFTRASIIGRVASGRSAVAIGNSGGAIVFVLAANNATQKLKISPCVMGPISTDPTIAGWGFVTCHWTSSTR